MINNYSKIYIPILRKYAKLCDIFINACDSDLEGCNIGLIDAFSIIKKSNPKIKVKQVWINTLQNKDIIKAFTELIEPKWSWAYTSEARALIDAFIGFSSTREVSLMLKRVLVRLPEKFFSIGRVQSSLLYLIYLREKEIRNFISKKYWTIDGRINQQKYNLNIVHYQNNFDNFDKAFSIFKKIKNETIGEIIDVFEKEEEILSPTPLNTNKALILITSHLNISANQALKVLEDLYLNKIISYPRTDSDKYPNNYEHKKYISFLERTNSYGIYANKIINSKKFYPHQGKIWAGDHPPITPIMGLNHNSNKLETVLQSKVYDLIVRNYLGLFFENAQVKNTSIKIMILDELFIGNFSTLIYDGFFEVVNFISSPTKKHMFFNKGNVNILKIELNEHKTSPPSRYNDTSLLKLMERNNLGTKSTRPGHIEVLKQRGYVKNNQKISYISKVGFALMDSLKNIWEEFLNPSFTSEIEKMLDRIKEKETSMDMIIVEVKDKFLNLFDKLRNEENKENMINNMLRIITND